MKLNETTLDSIIRKSIRKTLRETCQQQHFPKDFTLYDENEITFNNHTVRYEVINDADSEYYPTIDNDNNQQYYIWQVTVTTNNGQSKSIKGRQYYGQPTQQVFYNLYNKLCKQLNIQPVQQETI